MNRLPNDEIIDEINIRIVPRFKSSELSGDEWRTSAQIELKRKGEVIYQRRYLNIKAALTFLPALMIQGFEDGLFNFPSAGRDGLCMQPGCSEKATVTMVMKHKYAEGHQLPDDNLGESYKTRIFCNKHANRGDCDYNDCDENYVVKSGNKGRVPGSDISVPVQAVVDARGLDMESEEGQRLFKRLFDDAIAQHKEEEDDK